MIRPPSPDSINSLSHDPGAVHRNRLRDSGVTPLRLPARSPNLNAFAERFVGSIKSECLERMVPLGERHLQAAVRAFVDHYHEERPHQGLGNARIAPTTTSLGTGPVRCRDASAASSSSTTAPPRKGVGRVVAHHGIRFSSWRYARVLPDARPTIPR